MSRIIKYIRSFFMRRRFGSCHKTVRFEKMGYLVGAQYIHIDERSDIQQGTYLTAWDNHGSLPVIKIGKEIDDEVIISAIEKLDYKVVSLTEKK